MAQLAFICPHKVDMSGCLLTIDHKKAEQDANNQVGHQTFHWIINSPSKSPSYSVNHIFTSLAKLYNFRSLPIFFGELRVAQ